MRMFYISISQSVGCTPFPSPPPRVSKRLRQACSLHGVKIDKSRPTGRDGHSSFHFSEGQFCFQKLGNIALWDKSQVLLQCAYGKTQSEQLERKFIRDPNQSKPSFSSITSRIFFNQNKHSLSKPLAILSSCSLTVSNPKQIEQHSCYVSRATCLCCWDL